MTYNRGIWNVKYGEIKMSPLFSRIVSLKGVLSPFLRNAILEIRLYKVCTVFLCTQLEYSEIVEVFCNECHCVRSCFKGLTPEKKFNAWQLNKKDCGHIYVVCLDLFLWLKLRKCWQCQLGDQYNLSGQRCSWYNWKVHSVNMNVILI